MQKRSSLPVILFLMVIITAFAQVGRAQDAIQIEDSKNELANLTGAHNVTPFAKAFTCGQPVSFFIRTGQCKLHCEYGLCEETCGWSQVTDASLQAEDCSADSVSIYSTLGHAMTATSADYTSASNSISRVILQSIGLFYEHIEKVRIEQVAYPFAKGFIEDGQMKPTMLTMIAFSIFPDRIKDESQGMMLLLDLSRSGLDQLMCLSENTPCDTADGYVIKRKGLVNGPH
jgi:hypothetical protein